jgi:hypothetical protein
VLCAGHGCLIAEDDVGHFAAQCLRLLREPVLRAKLAAQARAYAKSWSAPALADRMLDFYARTLAAARAPQPAPPVAHVAPKDAADNDAGLDTPEEQRSAAR